MTIRSILSRRAARAAAVLGAAGAAGALTLTLTAAAAQAQPLRPEFFTINFPAATGEAFGPVHGAFTDNERNNGTSGVWVFENGGRVLVDHDAVTPPRINPFTCSGFARQRVAWEMTGLSGRDRHAFGFGHALVSTRVIVGRHHDGRCNPNDVLAETTAVAGSGLAANGR